MLNFWVVICQVVLVRVLQKTFCKKNKNYIYYTSNATHSEHMACVRSIRNWLIPAHLILCCELQSYWLEQGTITNFKRKSIIETATKLRDKKHPNIRILIIPKQDLAVDRQSQVINKQNQPIRQTTLYSKCYIKGLNWMYSTSNLKDTGHTGPFLFNFHVHM